MEAGFRAYHPYVLFLYYVMIGILLMIFNHPLFLFTALVLLILNNLSHDKGHMLKQWGWALLIMGGIFILLNPILVSRGTNILFYFRGKQVTLEALMYGITMSLALITVIVLFVSFNIILNGNKFLYIFSKVLPRSAFLTMLSIRFIPLVKRRLIEIMEVQRIKGMTISNGPLKYRMKNGMSFLKILLTWSLEEAIQTADSMKARGYGIGKKSSYIPYQFGKKDLLWLIGLSLLFSICMIGSFLGYGKIIIYPELGTLHMFPIDWLVYVAMILVISFPLIVTGKEAITWHY